jgi:hypothetical protein
MNPNFLQFAEQYENILYWLEQTTEFMCSYNAQGALLYLEIELGKKRRIQVIINTEKSTFCWKCNYKITLGNIETIEDLILELRIYYDRIYKIRLKRNLDVFR